MLYVTSWCCVAVGLEYGGFGVGTPRILATPKQPALGPPRYCRSGMAPIYAELVQLEKKVADKEVEVKAVSRRHARAVKRAAEAKAEYQKCGKKPAQRGKVMADVIRYREKKKRLRQKCKDREGELMELVRELRELISCLETREQSKASKGDLEKEVQLQLKLASDNDLSSLDGWEFGNLPRPRLPCEPPRALPPSLGELLHVQPTLLRQLSHVKLRILARAYQRVYPDDSKGLSEHDLYARMRAAIQSVVSLEWQPHPPMLPEVPAGWAGEVTACVSHWLLGWGRGSRGRAMNVCCHDGSVSEETLMAALGNPSESLIDAYVAVAQRPCISLEALMALLCACPLLVRLTDMPKDSGLLDKAVTTALKAAAFRLPGIDRMALVVLQRQGTTSFAHMMRAIQEQLAVPLVVIFTEMEVIHSPAYEHLFAPGMGKLPGHLTPAEKLMRTAEKLTRTAKTFLKAIQAPLYDDPHLFYATATKCPGVPAWADPMTPSSGCMLYNMNVMHLRSIQGK
ncbi:g4359 [Coccomyxa viridis]|uniref:G4359 protein n=1 Tax=Coccomyxa viridis TaxID=1274662 RepID=A0ABP1FU36_9CHLO